jgi:hypothetical protein
MDMVLHTHKQVPVAGMYLFVTMIQSFIVHWMTDRLKLVR